MELPLSKIKRIAKFDPDVKLVSHEGAVALTLSCEMFIKHVAEHVHQQTRLGKRKTIQIRDFDACLQNVSAFSFLDGVLETWSDISGQPGANSASKTPKEKEPEPATDQVGDVDLVDDAIDDVEESVSAAAAMDAPTNSTSPESNNDENGIIGDITEEMDEIPPA